DEAALQVIGTQRGDVVLALGAALRSGHPGHRGQHAGHCGNGSEGESGSQRVKMHAFDSTPGSHRSHGVRREDDRGPRRPTKSPQGVALHPRAENFNNYPGDTPTMRLRPIAKAVLLALPSSLAISVGSIAHAQQAQEPPKEPSKAQVPEKLESIV